MRLTTQRARAFYLNNNLKEVVMIEKYAKIGERVKFWHAELSNIGICEIGDDSVIHAGVHIHDYVRIGKHCQIEAQSFIPTGVTLEDEVFVGPGVIFTNDPKLNKTGSAKGDWQPTKTLVKKGAKIGAGARILAGVTIGNGAVVGMGAVVLEDVPDYHVVVGSPAKFIKTVKYEPEPEEQDFSHLNNDHFTDNSVSV
jgi:UDP-2-acetamido-3-amino-2,3-dideoxy-glucuronate N-acetyltransferase